MKALLPLLLLSGSTFLPFRAPAMTITWKGYTWNVKSGSALGPGPNSWDAANVFVDAKGDLHLKISRSVKGWTCAEVSTQEPLGFGTYQWQVDGPVDKLDRNVVLGLFGYRGPDEVNEIDVEFAQWGHANPKVGNWTVYPASGPTVGSFSFPFKLSGTYTTSRYTWSSNGVEYWLMGGHQPVDKTRNVIQTWKYSPNNSRKNVTQTPMPLCMNLWLFKGQGPTDGKPVEIVIHDFTWTSLK